MAKTFPAVLIGGPPHSGKSVLVYSLTQALRQARAPHYALRACPDGEGDWANEADQILVRTIRSKGAFTGAFMERVAGYLQKRHLPLLVDVGGKPTPAQEAVFAYCTHAVLLAGEREDDPAAYGRDLAAWRAMMARQGVPVIAEIKSQLGGEDNLTGTEPVIRGTISRLERGKTAAGPAFAALVKRLQALFDFTEAELTRLHLALAPAELTLDLPALARTLGAADGRWRPEQLPSLGEYLPQGKPLAIYGRAPNWIYAFLGLMAYPAPVWLFDARLGWIQPPTLPVISGSKAAGQPGWAVDLHVYATYALLDMKTQAQFLDIEAACQLPLTAPPANRGVILSGKIPHWLMMAAARQIAPAVPWTAVYQPPLGGAVVITPGSEERRLGDFIPLAPNAG
ncbi:MAG TPA: hypothetical protein ENK32_05190 [Anaerolineae bacterium]|nr:hypothetical protein [Anaerolineae bacterium]